MSTIPMLTHDFTDRGFDTIEIYPISDMHVGSKEFDVDKLKQLVDEIASEPNRFVMLGGDLADNATRSSVGDIFSATIPPREQPTVVADLLRPIADRILAVVAGNHCWRTVKDTDLDPMAMIAAKLNVEHLYEPDLAFVKLVAGKRLTNKVRSPNYCVGITHGTSNGSTLGAGINKAEPFAIAMGVDLLIIGHTHRPVSAVTTRYECIMNNSVMVEREVRILVSTGWLRYAGYPARKMLRPVAIRPNKAILDCHRFDISVLS